MSIEDILRSAKTPLGATLEEGVKTLSYDQTVTFWLYVRIILPLDGYVFWVRADSVDEGALFNGLMFNSTLYNAAPTSVERTLPPYKVEARGSLHYSTITTQEQESNEASNRVVFTALEPITDLNEVGSHAMYIAKFDVPQSFDDASNPVTRTQIRFAFSQRESYYRQAGLHHYVGAAVLPTMDSQIVDNPLKLIGLYRQRIVSNSLPFWLSFNQYSPPWPVPIPRPSIPFYPSFLVPDNMRPPYAAVHIEPGGTTGLQAQPYYDRTYSQYELTEDRVDVTVYGANNQAVMDLITSFSQYAFDTEDFGITNIPVPRDEKEGQSEFNTLAQKKRITFAISYNASAARRVARQLILHCTPKVFVGDVQLETHDIIGE